MSAGSGASGHTAAGLGPPPLPAELEARRERRLAAAFALIGVAVFGIAAILDPYDGSGLPRTSGTHRQLGLPACSIESIAGVGCPSCGMTTAFSLLLHGDPAAAWSANWAGCVAAVAGAAGTAWFLLVAAGLPAGRFTADEVVKWIVVVGMGAALVRWLAGVSCAALASV